MTPEKCIMYELSYATTCLTSVETEIHIQVNFPNQTFAMTKPVTGRLKCQKYSINSSAEYEVKTHIQQVSNAVHGQLIC
jgi:hypothetical protein